MHKGSPCGLADRGQQGLNGGVVTKGFAAVFKAVDVARAKDKAAAQLERVPAKLVLRVSGGFGAGARLDIIAAQKMEQVSALEVHDGVGFALFINQEGEGNASFFAKRAGINAIAQAYGGQVGTAVPEGLFVRAQLRDMLAAENSTVMA